MTRLAITGMDAREHSKGASRETPKEALESATGSAASLKPDRPRASASPALARHLF